MKTNFLKIFDYKNYPDYVSYMYVELWLDSYRMLFVKDNNVVD